MNVAGRRAGARTPRGGEPAKALLLEWLKEIGYEEHLHEGEESAGGSCCGTLDERARFRRLDRAGRCGGTGWPGGGPASEREAQSVLAVAQTISVIISLAERGDDQDVVTLSTLHAAKGLEWPHVVLASVNEGLLPFRRRRRGGERGCASRRSAA